MVPSLANLPDRRAAVAGQTPALVIDQLANAEGQCPYADTQEVDIGPISAQKPGAGQQTPITSGCSGE